MTNQVGRGQPCPCGSGRKYKNCCYRRDAEATGGRRHSYPDADWQRLRRTEGEIINAVVLFARRHFSENLLGRALLEFGAGSTIPEEQLTLTIFVPWFVFNWLPAPAKQSLFGTAPPPEPLAVTYLAEHGSQLDDYQKSFIQAACSEPFSFFVVTAAEPGRSLTLRDLLLTREVTVKERQASETLRRGNVIYARCVSLAGQSILLGVAPIPLPPETQGALLELRDMLKKTTRNSGPLDPLLLHSKDGFLRSIYFENADQVLNPPPPVLQNTDGDPLVPVRLRYNLRCTPEQALDGLRSLVLPEFQEEILNDADFDDSGKLVRVSLTWQKRGNRLHPEWDNTTLGQIQIRRGALEVEVNSTKREAKIRREIRDRLGDQCTFMEEERQSVETLLQKQEGQREMRRPQDLEETMSPELRAAVKAQMRAHWQAWLDKPIPALKNQSPRRAARTPEGRERLEALLMEFEYRNESMSQPELRPDVGELRRQLGLSE
jgi:hypothetical protein